MEIKKIETVLTREGNTPGVSQSLFVKVHTNSGITGLGEVGTWGHLNSVDHFINSIKHKYLGRDPLKREYHMQRILNENYFDGSIIMGAVSAIDIALWDITGKFFDTPVYQLLGGQRRDKVRAAVHPYAEDTKELIKECSIAVEEGFTAIGVLDPFLYSQDITNKYESLKINNAVERVRKCREAVGYDIDLCIDIHRKLSLSGSLDFGHEVSEYKPLYLEDPLPPTSIESMTTLGEKLPTPLATGERLYRIQDFKNLMRKGSIPYIRPDIGLCGGITQVQKIISIAEAQDVQVIPHTFSPVNTAISLQIDAVMNNVPLQDFPYKPSEGVVRNENIVDDPPEWKDGFLLIPDKPGIGIELDETQIKSR